MKKLCTLLALVITLITNAQAPQGFNYQATVRNSTGALITNQNVNFKVSVLLNLPTSLPVYSETHLAPTDDLGQVSLVVGSGNPTVGTFAAINWANGTYYLGIELNTGSGYVSMGTTQLLSVPYALYAKNAGGLTHYVGELFGGGIVVAVWKTAGQERGLIASLTDLSTSMQWTTSAFQNTLVGPTAQSFTDGLANTNAIVAQAGSGTSYAAGLCKAYNAGGFNDWYLPAAWELNLCYNSAVIINDVLGDSDGLKPSFYLSSTESSSSSVWYQFLGNGYPNFGSKNDFYSVRAVKRF